MARFDSAQRARILAAAVQVFAERGLRGATVRLVGERAGVNSALLYYYFENKDMLFAETVRLVIAGLIARMEQPHRPFAGARERLAYLVDAVFDYYTAHPDRMRLMSVGIALHGALVGQAINGFLKTHPATPLEVVREGMARGELRRQHPVVVWWDVLALCIFSLHIHTVVEHIDFAAVPFPMPPLEDSRRQIVDLLVQGLALQPEAPGGPKRTRRRSRPALSRSASGQDQDSKR